MKKFIFILLLAVGGWFIYDHYWAKEEAPVKKEEVVAEVKPVVPKPRPKVVKKPPKPKSVDAYIQSQQYDKALSVLDKAPPNKRNQQWLLKRAEIMDALGRRSEAEKLLVELLPKARLEQKPSLLLFLGQVQLDQNKINEGEATLLKLFDDHKGADEAEKAAHQLRKIWRGRGVNLKTPENLRQMNRVMTHVLDATVDPELQKQCVDQLNKINRRLFFAPASLKGLVEFYRVKHGDSLFHIAKRFKVYSERLKRINRIRNPNDIKVGQTLRVVMGKMKIKVNREEFMLTAYIDGLFFKRYPVGIGKDGQTPSVVTSVSEGKAMNPTWRDPADMKIYAANDKKNPIGTRWIPLDMGQGYGIHGTREPDSIGKESSNGCIRLLNRDVEELYDYVMTGDEVVIE